MSDTNKTNDTTWGKLAADIDEQYAGKPFSVKWPAGGKPKGVEYPSEIPTVDADTEKIITKLDELEAKREKYDALVNEVLTRAKEEVASNQGEVRNLEKEITDSAQELGKILGGKMGIEFRQWKDRLLLVMGSMDTQSTEPNDKWKLEKYRKIVGEMMPEKLEEIDKAFQDAINGMLAHTKQTVIDKRILTYPKPKGLKGAALVQADLMGSIKTLMVKVWDTVVGITKAMVGYEELIEKVEQLVDLGKSIKDPMYDTYDQRWKDYSRWDFLRSKDERQERGKDYLTGKKGR